MAASRIPSISRPSHLKRAREDAQQESYRPIYPTLPELPPADIYTSPVFHNPAPFEVPAAYDINMAQEGGDPDLHLPPDYKYIFVHSG